VQPDNRRYGCGEGLERATVVDSASVNTWIAQQNAGMCASHAADPLTWDDVDLKEAFDIPDVVAPVRLPDDEALTALAVAAPLLVDLRGLARDVREAPVRAVSVDPLLLGPAAEAELVERDGDTLVPGEDVEWLDDITGGTAALDAWDYAFAQVLDTTLETADQAGIVDATSFRSSTVILRGYTSSKSSLRLPAVSREGSSIPR
jgi:hypothetical protein